MDNPYDPTQAQTLTDHLGELRDRLIKAAYGIVGAAALCWIFHERLFDIVRGPIKPFLKDGKLTYLNPMDSFMVHVKIALLGGVMLSLPIWLYQAWMFVAPGLYAKERRHAFTFITAGTVLFLTGAVFAYFLVLPMAFDFLLQFSAEGTAPLITITEYMSFFLTTVVVFGCAFELPLAIVLLGVLGIVNQKMLREKRRYAVVGMAAVSAVVTPPDVLSMCMLLVPLWILYEVSILLVGMIARRKETPPFQA